jgi:hypothetical protein
MAIDIRRVVLYEVWAVASAACGLLFSSLLMLLQSRAEGNNARAVTTQDAQRRAAEAKARPRQRADRKRYTINGGGGETTRKASAREDMLYTKELVTSQSIMA